MINLDIREIHSVQDVDSRLRDMHQVLSISISLANGMVWKEKTKSFYEVIAREVDTFFKDNLIENIELQKFNNKYLRVSTPNNSLIFLKNNLFDMEQKNFIDKDKWLKQRLVFLENKELPDYLTGKEKEKMFETLSDDDRDILNRNYNRQELNSDRFILNLNKEDKFKLIEILTEYDYFSITVLEYIKMLSTGRYNYKNSSNDYTMRTFKKTYNNYILEIGAYIAKNIENYLNER